VAIYSFRVSVIKRSAGRSSVAAAAYRAGEALRDERTGTTHDYSRKGGVLHSEIIAPRHAPDWCHDREELWNAVEARETRVNSQTAREITMALPHELTDHQREELVRGFLEKECVSRGMVADFAIHLPDRDGDQRNHHAHAMLTLREVGSEGFTRKAREWNDRNLLDHWRSSWAEHCNTALERAGRPERVDHRTLDAQGEDREPTQHEGPDVTAMIREDVVLDAANANEQKRRRNAERSQLEERRAELDVMIERPELIKSLGEAKPDKAALKQAMKALKKADHSHGELNAIRHEIAKERRTLYAHDKRAEHLGRLDMAVEGGFASVFKNPEQAMAQFKKRCAEGKKSPAQIAREMMRKPAHFGALRGRRIAILWQSAERKEALLSLPILAEKARKGEYLRRKLERQKPKVEQAKKRLRQLAERRADLEKTPSPERLIAQRQLQQAARGLSNNDWNALSWDEKKTIADARRLMRDEQTRRFADRQIALMRQQSLERDQQRQQSLEEERERERQREIERQNERSRGGPGR